MKLKTIINLGVALFLSFAFYSCEDLEEDNSGVIGAQTYYADEVSLKAGILGIHAKVGRYKRPNGAWIPTSGDDIITTQPANNKQPWRDFDQFQAHEGTEGLDGDFYIPQYEAIKAANSFITSIENSSDLDIPEELINQRLGEAKFLRAYVYFDLVRLMGDVPYFEDVEFKEKDDTRRVLKRDIYTEIIEDLEYAMEWCVEIPEAKGQITKYAAAGMLAKVNMMLAGFPYNENDKWERVRELCSEIIESNRYDLMPSFWELFDFKASNSNTEDIFTITYGIYVAGNQTHYRGAGKAWDSWADMYMQWEFYNRFPEGERKKYTCAASTSLESTNQYAHPAVTKFLYGTIPFDPHAENHAIWAENFENDARTSHDMQILRLADVYLMWAEAEANITQSVTSDAVEYLNKIKRRAVGDTTGSFRYWNNPNAEIDFEVADFSSWEAFRDTIFEERGWEFAAEWGNRWFDIVRLDKLAEVSSRRFNYDTDAAVQLLLDHWISNPRRNTSPPSDEAIERQRIAYEGYINELPLTDETPTTAEHLFMPFHTQVLTFNPSLLEDPIPYEGD